VTRAVWYLCVRFFVFTGKAAIYYGKDAYFDDKKDTHY
jgi:hypothetical protein